MTSSVCAIIHTSRSSRPSLSVSSHSLQCEHCGKPPETSPQATTGNQLSCWYSTITSTLYPHRARSIGLRPMLRRTAVGSRVCSPLLKKNLTQWSVMQMSFCCNKRNDLLMNSALLIASYCCIQKRDNITHCVLHLSNIVLSRHANSFDSTELEQIVRHNLCLCAL